MTTEIYRNMLLEGARAARDRRRGGQRPADPLEPQRRRAGCEASDVAELARAPRLDEELSGVGCVDLR